MDVRLFFSVSDYSSFTIIPLVQDDSLANRLHLLSDTYNLPLDWLLRYIKAEHREAQHIPFEQGSLVLLGFGKKTHFNSILKSIRNFIITRKQILPSDITLDLRYISDPLGWIEPVVTGISLGLYNIGLLKSEPLSMHTFTDESRVNILLDREVDLLEGEILVQQALHTAATQRSVMDLVNLPGRHKTPQKLCDWAENSGRMYGYTVTILDKEKLEIEGLNALLSVSKGSQADPALIIMEYNLNPDISAQIGLVGKGVTFDTGGISIKASANMHYMKSDMGGAAAVLGAVELAAKLKLPISIVAVIPVTENCVDGAGTKPGDVINSYTGKSIEVIDTDAEGRLILADALEYIIGNYQPETLIDLATLTGNCVLSLGYTAAGLFTQNDELAQQLLRAGDRAGEKLWRLPMWEEVQDELRSDIADIKNLGNKPVAGAILAAKFLEFFTAQHSTWAHLDIAGVAFGDTDYGSQKTSTAYGVRLLVELMKEELRIKN